jgi:hypothetical protein
MLVLGSVADLYRDSIVDTGRETQFLFFVSFLVLFGFIRTSAHMIKAQVSWWQRARHGEGRPAGRRHRLRSRPHDVGIGGPGRLDLGRHCETVKH